MEQLSMLARRIRKLRLALLRWIQENTFAPPWLPGPLRRTLSSYLIAGLAELAASLLILLVTSLTRGHGFYGILTLVVLVLIGVGWGDGSGNACHSGDK
jgi:hypothetical protein